MTQIDNWKLFVLNYEHNDSFNLLSAVRAKYGDVALEDFLDEAGIFIQEQITLAKFDERKRVIEEIEKLPRYDVDNNGFNQFVDGDYIKRGQVINKKQ